MRRREFITGALAAIAGWLLPKGKAEPKPDIGGASLEGPVVQLIDNPGFEEHGGDYWENQLLKESVARGVIRLDDD